ncbi:hypothetical protein AGDE_16200 [Angomonas deanei]|nr:hypothetical protein AGDE_16200 [Angomonas deanei]|eukprot:EPY17555.1 hypothetical protein AGDE_16200 [Angomonas deanei]
MGRYCDNYYCITTALDETETRLRRLNEIWDEEKNKNERDYTWKLVDAERRARTAGVAMLQRLKKDLLDTYRQDAIATFHLTEGQSYYASETFLKNECDAVQQYLQIHEKEKKFRVGGFSPYDAQVQYTQQITDLYYTQLKWSLMLAALGESGTADDVQCLTERRERAEESIQRIGEKIWFLRECV